MFPSLVGLSFSSIALYSWILVPFFLYLFLCITEKHSNVEYIYLVIWNIIIVGVGVGVGVVVVVVVNLSMRANEPLSSVIESSLAKIVRPTELIILFFLPHSMTLISFVFAFLRALQLALCEKKRESSSLPNSKDFWCYLFQLESPW